MTDEQRPVFVPVGLNDARPFGMDARERACRLAAGAGFPTSEAIVEGRAVLLSSMRYAWDPEWLSILERRPNGVLTLEGEPAFAHVAAGENPAPAIAGLEDRHVPMGYEVIESETANSGNSSVGQEEHPFLMPLDVERQPLVERAAFDAAYRRVADALTLHLWRGPAFHVTRWAARAKLAPNLISLVGALLCVASFFLFWRGEYWWGALLALLFMVLDTVDGQLARVTGTCSRVGMMVDRGIDLVHPPFWYWAWEHGLHISGQSLEPVLATMTLWTIVGGYVAQRIIEAVFAHQMKFSIHLWRPVDSMVRLVAAERNPNMVLLLGSLMFRRPDVGLELVACWTLVCLIFHAVRLSQARECTAAGETISPWLAS